MTGYIGSRGRCCHAPTSSITAIVTELIVGNVRAVLFAKECADLSHSHAASVHGNDFVVDTCEAALVVRNQDGRETAVAIAWNVQFEWAIVGQHGLAAGAITLALGALGALSVRRVAQVMAEFCAQCALDQHLFEGHRDVLNRLGCHRAFNELFDQLFGNEWQVFFGRAGRGLFAWRVMHLKRMLCPNTKFLTVP